MTSPVAAPDRAAASAPAVVREPLTVAYAVALAAIVLVVVRVVIPVFRTDALYDDYRQNFFWLTQVHAGVDFSGTDPLTRYARDFQPPALAWAYEALARVVDPYLATKSVGVVLIGAFALALWRVGARAAPRSVFAPILVALGLCDEIWIREMAGGLSRAFGPPLQIAIVACVLGEKWWLAIVWIAAAGLVHPQSLLLGTSFFAVGWGCQVWRERRDGEWPPNGRRVRPAVAAVVIVAALAWLNVQHAREMHGRFGPFLSRDAIFESVDYGPGGRFRNERPQNFLVESARTLSLHVGVPEAALVRVPPFAPASAQLGFALGALAACVLTLEALRRLVRARWSDVPWFVPACLVLAAAWQTAAWLALPQLYFPRRFLATFVPLAFFGALAWLLDRWLVQLATASAGRRRLAMLLLAVVFVLASVRRFGAHPAGYAIERAGYEGVAQFLADRPLATRYAASPRGDADTLLALVPRRAFIASEISHPLFRDYLERTVRPRTQLVTRALFPEDPLHELAALRAAGVDLLVARRRDLSWDELPASFAYEPIRSEVSAYWNHQHRARRDAFWARYTPAAIAYQDEAFVVFDLRKIDLRAAVSESAAP